ncbi:MAG: chemotaxis protein CheW [Treponema sp.]|nr:chemotaxis protein CheW [Treponema sp.]
MSLNEETNIKSINDQLSEQFGQASVSNNDTQGINLKDTTVVDFKMVTFSLAGKDYAIDIMHVKEIAKAGRFTYVPNTLPFVLGVYNLRGDIIPILDLRLFFNIDVPERDDNQLENLLILSIGDQTFGVVVDKIDKVVGVRKNSIQPPHPLFGDINIKYIYGVVEANSRLYVLLDITRIFGSKAAAEEAQVKKVQQPVVKNAGSAPVSAAVKAQKAAAVEAKPAPVQENKGEVDLHFLEEGLKTYKKFTVSDINRDWVKYRYSEWQKEGKKLIQNETDADDFLKGFWSKHTDSWWSKEFADAVYQLLPDNNAKQIVVWNPGCGKGCESYSLACILAKRYPDAKIRIYAQDIDLLKVSNASLVSLPSELQGTWYDSFLAKKASGELTFNQSVKDSIMFEYHDCKNTNALPMVDVIFARDVLSLLDKEAQDFVTADFLEKMKGNAVAFVGENERLPVSLGFGENTIGTLTAYSKE